MAQALNFGLGTWTFPNSAPLATEILNNALYGVMSDNHFYPSQPVDIPIGIVVPCSRGTRSYIYILYIYDLNLSSYVVNIEEESEVQRTPAPKTVHILYTTIIFM